MPGATLTPSSRPKPRRRPRSGRRSRTTPRADDEQALAAVIDRVIVPEIRYVRERLALVDRRWCPGTAAAHCRRRGIPHLRDESWILRANALRGGKISILWIADRKEALSLEALRRVRPEPLPRRARK
jgi:hypothetical protein